MSSFWSGHFFHTLVGFSPSLLVLVPNYSLCPLKTAGKGVKKSRNVSKFFLENLEKLGNILKNALRTLDIICSCNPWRMEDEFGKSRFFNII